MWSLSLWLVACVHARDRAVSDECCAARDGAEDVDGSFTGDRSSNVSRRKTFLLALGQPLAGGQAQDPVMGIFSDTAPFFR